MLLHLLVVQMVVAAAAPSPISCSYGDAHPQAAGSSAGPSSQDDRLSCQPAATVGSVSVTVDLNETEAAERYLQASVMSFVNPSPVTTTIDVIQKQVKGRDVMLALLPLGADEGHTIGDAKMYLEAAGQHGADLAVLPELFNNREIPVNLLDHNSSVCPNPETLDGPTITWVSRIAKRHSMYVVAPICELARGRRWNSAVLVGRDGVVVGAYHKVFPVFGCPDEGGGDCDYATGEQGVAPGWAGVGVFSLDFGRISLLTCFDINFPELWHEAYALGSELVVWPSAMNSSSDPSAPSYARLHQYHVAGVGTPGTVYQPTGVAMPVTVPNASLPLLKLVSIDLDASWAHWDNNREKVHTLLAENPAVKLVVPGPPFYYLQATAPGVSVRALFAKYKIESARNYILRSRIGLNKIRAAGSCVLPGHGDPLCGGGDEV